MSKQYPLPSKPTVWMPDGSSANAPDAGLRARRSPIGIVGGGHGTLRERVQDVGEQQLLMLLLVMKTDLENADHLGPLRFLHDREQPLDRFVDMSPEGGDVFAIRPREQPASRARLAWAGRDIVGVEEISEAFVEHAIARETRRQQELLQEPGRMRAMPFRRTGIGHRLHDLILRAQQRGAAFGLGPHGAEGIAPDAAWIVR